MIAETSIKRPIATTLLMAAILVFGIFAYTLLPVSDLPNVDFPTISVNANLPGASFPAAIQVEQVTGDAEEGHHHPPPPGGTRETPRGGRGGTMKRPQGPLCASLPLRMF